jgi:D-3-phosphoglycerate dehydrogenase
MRIETSFYGDLNQYANWLTAPVVSGISSDFDPLFDFRDAAAYLDEKGIGFENRAVDDHKPFNASMTVDLVEGQGSSFTRVSVRGTVTEGLPMISRIDNFDRLYFDPRGYSVLVVYDDKPGMLAKITSVLGQHDINIDDMRAPQDPETGRAIAVLKVNRAVSPAVIEEIRHAADAEKAVFLLIRE